MTGWLVAEMKNNGGVKATDEHAAFDPALLRQLLVCCSVLQCVAVCCSVLLCVAVCCVLL